MEPPHDLGIFSTLIPNFESERCKVREISTSGFVIGLGMTWKGPQHLYSEFPIEWRQIYERRNFYLGDPILLWFTTKTGSRRWSEIKFPDIQNVLGQAKEYGLVFGAIFAQKSRGGRCFFSVARPDREFTDAEIEILEARFKAWVEYAMDRASLNDGELAVLRCFRDGFGQRETADHLGVSESTVKQRSSRAQTKLGAKSRTQAVAIAMTRNFIE